jgi:hypothetical protein
LISENFSRLAHNARLASVNVEFTSSAHHANFVVKVIILTLLAVLMTRASAFGRVEPYGTVDALI